MLMTRRQLCASLLGTAAVSAFGSLPSFAQATWKPEKPVEIIVGTNPGTGFDRTSRALQKIIQENKLMDVPQAVINKPGGGGTLGYAYMNLKPGDGHYISVISPLFLTNHLTAGSPIKHTDVTPLSVVVSEEIVFAVKADSPMKTGQDFVDRLRKAPDSVTVGMSGVGGQNHITLGLVGKAAGIDIKKLKVVGFTGSSDAVTAVLGGHVELAVGPASTVQQHVEAKTMRVLAIASRERIEAPWADTPTWVEQGYDAVFSNWRGFVGPKGMTAAQIAYWDGIFAKVVASKEWKEEVEKSQLTPVYLDSTKTKAFLDTENAKLVAVLKDLGLTTG
jgi:putative tricarboxylic transport membrane protein